MKKYFLLILALVLVLVAGTLFIKSYKKSLSSENTQSASTTTPQITQIKKYLSTESCQQTCKTFEDLFTPNEGLTRKSVYEKLFNNEFIPKELADACKSDASPLVDENCKPSIMAYSSDHTKILYIFPVLATESTVPIFKLNTTQHTSELFSLDGKVFISPDTKNLLRVCNEDYQKPLRLCVYNIETDIERIFTATTTTPLDIISERILRSVTYDFGWLSDGNIFIGLYKEQCNPNTPEENCQVKIGEQVISLSDFK